MQNAETTEVVWESLRPSLDKTGQTKNILFPLILDPNIVSSIHKNLVPIGTSSWSIGTESRNRLFLFLLTCGVTCFVAEFLSRLGLDGHMFLYTWNLFVGYPRLRAM